MRVIKDTEGHLCSIDCGKKYCRDCPYVHSASKSCSFFVELLTWDNDGRYFRSETCLNADVTKAKKKYVVYCFEAWDLREKPPLDILPMLVKNKKKAEKLALKISKECHVVIGIGPVALEKKTEMLFLEGDAYLRIGEVDDLDNFID